MSGTQKPHWLSIDEINPKLVDLRAQILECVQNGFPNNGFPYCNIKITLEQIPECFELLAKEQETYKMANNAFATMSTLQEFNRSDFYKIDNDIRSDFLQPYNSDIKLYMEAWECITRYAIYSPFNTRMPVLAISHLLTIYYPNLRRLQSKVYDMLIGKKGLGY